MKIILFILLLTISTAAIVAQQTKPSTNKPIIQKTKVPTVKATIANMVTGTYSVAAIKILVDSNLVITDEKGKRYSFAKCSFLYKRKMTYTDENTGEKKVTWEYLNKELRNNEQLDAFWRTTIKQDLKKDEALIFEKILVDSGKGYMLTTQGIILTAQ